MTQLDELLVSGEEVNKDLVGSILAPYIRFERETGSIIPQAEWQKLTERHKVLVFLAARKGLRALGLCGDHEDVMPGAIEEATGLVGGTVRSALFRLTKQRLIAKRKGGGYYVPNWALQSVKDALSQPERA